MSKVESLPVHEAVTEQICQKSETTENQESFADVWKLPNSNPTTSPNLSGSPQHKENLFFERLSLEQYENPHTDKNTSVCEEALNSTQSQTMSDIPDHDTNLLLSCDSSYERHQAIQETKTGQILQHRHVF